MSALHVCRSDMTLMEEKARGTGWGMGEARDVTLDTASRD